LTIQVGTQCFYVLFQTATTEQNFALANIPETVSSFRQALDSVLEHESFIVNGQAFDISLADAYTYRVSVNDMSIVLDNEASLLFYKFWTELC